MQTSVCGKRVTRLLHATLSVALTLFSLLTFQSGLVRAAVLPELPRTFLDTTYAPPVGNTINVPAGGDLQAAINNAALGDTIVLQAGVTYCCQFSLPNKTTGSGWIYIRSSAYSSLPAPGNRISPADAANMPKISVGANDGGAIDTLAGAHHYRFVGIEFKPVANAFVYSLINVGSGETSLASLPHDITFDRCYIHSDPSAGGRRGVAMNGARVAVIDSYVAGFKENGADTQAVWTYNSPGPLKIVNNYLESAGENFLMGGADSSITNLVPSDIEVRGNYFFKPLAWIGQTWTVKNLLEFKSAQRVLVEGNTFENNWQSSQSGFGVLFTPRNQDGGAPWSVVQDITFRLNRLINVGSGITLSGRDTTYSSQVMRRVLIENNVMTVTRLNGADGRILQVVNGPIDTTIRHNTALITVAGGLFGFTENNPKADQFDLRDNIVTKGDYGFTGTGTGEGTATLNGQYTNYTFLKNALIGGSAGSYPANNFFPAVTATVGFMNLLGGDYRLSAASPYKNAGSDGKDVGADIVALNGATACAVNGQCGTVTPPPPDGTPPTISAVGVSAVTSSQAVVGWTTNEAADTQVDYGLTTAYGNSTALNAAASIAHSQSVSGLSASTLYHYRVKSRDAAGNLATSGDFTFTTTAASDATAPVISGITTSAVSASGATVVWTTNEAADTLVEYGLTTAYGSSTTLNAAMLTSHSQGLGGLTASKLYHYRVKSRDAAGNLATSADFTFTTLPPTDTTAPVISAVTASAVTASGATIGWTTNEAADTLVEYGRTTAYGSSTALNAAMLTAHSQGLSGLSPSKRYHYRVKSRDAAGNLATSADFTFTTLPPTDTTAPVISAVTASSVTASSAAIAWSTNESADTLVEYGLTTAYGSSTALNAAMVTAHSQGVSGLSASSVYHYRVKSKDAAGNMATSADSTFTTQAPPDTTAPVISAVTASAVTTSGATIGWITNEGADTLVEYGLTTAYGSSTVLNAAMLTTHSQGLSGLSTSTLYHYRVKSKDAAGNLATSGDFTLTTTTPANTAPTAAITSPAAGSSVFGVVQIAAAATDDVGVAGVRFFLDGTALGAEILAAPYVLSWNTAGVAKGAHTLTAVARDSAGNTTTSAPVSVVVANRSPYGGTAFQVPGRIEAENFDVGGEGVTYHDLTAGNQGGTYRTTEDVDIITPSAGVYVVNGFQTGEWLEYTLNVATAGNYVIDALVSSGYATSRFHVEIDGVDRTGSITVPITASWATFQWVGAKTVNLAAGQHVMRVVADQQYFNIDAIRVMQP